VSLACPSYSIKDCPRISSYLKSEGKRILRERSKIGLWKDWGKEWPNSDQLLEVPRTSGSAEVKRHIARDPNSLREEDKLDNVFCSE
jgi:hypothetical protein